MDEPKPTESEIEPRVTIMPGLGPVGSTRRRASFFAFSGLATLGTLYFFREVLGPFALALILAYVLAPLVRRVSELEVAGRRLPRWVAVVTVYACLLSTLGASLAFGTPRLIAEVQRLGRELPQTLEELRVQWVPRIEESVREASVLYGAPSTERPTSQQAAAGELTISPREGGGYEVSLPPGGIEVVAAGEGRYRIGAETARDSQSGRGFRLSNALARAFQDTEASTTSAFRHVQGVISKVIGGVFSFFITLMLSAYLLATSDSVLGFFRSLVRAKEQPRFDQLIERIDQGLGGVVRGQLLIALVNGALSGLGFWLADLRYWPVLTVVATLLSLIPIFGAIISSIPAVILGLQEGIGTAVFVLIWILGIHQLEANLLNPKIMGRAAKVHPVLVVFALLAGEQMYGIKGALLAVPVLSIVQSLFLHFRQRSLGPVST